MDKSINEYQFIWKQTIHKIWFCSGSFHYWKTLQYIDIYQKRKLENLIYWHDILTMNFHLADIFNKKATITQQLWTESP